jgi:hypothetical protein
MTVMHNLGSESKRATDTPMYIAIGQGGSILGSHLFLKAEALRYMYVPTSYGLLSELTPDSFSSKPFAVLCGLMFLSCLTAIVLSVSSLLALPWS